MSITISTSKPADRPAILELLNEARADNMSKEERARQGFIQGNIDEEILARFQAESGVFIARKQQKIVGVAMTSLPGMVSQGPPACSIETIRKTFPEVTENKIFLYGPATVRRNYRGQGILTQLLTYICSRLQTQYEMGIAFVELVNQKSLSIHRHYPMKEIACFTNNKRKYIVFTFSPKQVLRHYGKISKDGGNSTLNVLCYHSLVKGGITSASRRTGLAVALWFFNSLLFSSLVDKFPIHAPAA